MLNSTGKARGSLYSALGCKKLQVLMECCVILLCFPGQSEGSTITSTTTATVEPSEERSLLAKRRATFLSLSEDEDIATQDSSFCEFITAFWFV